MRENKKVTKYFTNILIETLEPNSVAFKLIGTQN